MGDTCEGCGAEVPVAGGITNIWTQEHTETGGLTLEFDDGAEYFLCFGCIDDLPDHPTAGDVEALGDG